MLGTISGDIFLEGGIARVGPKLANDPKTIAQEHQQWAALVLPHQRSNPDIGILSPDASLPYNVIAYERTVDVLGPDELRAMGKVMCGYSDQLVDIYKDPRHEQRLEEVATLFQEGKSVSAYFDHRGLLNVSIGGACFLIAMYEKDLIKPGDISLSLSVSAMLKHTSYKGQPIIPGLGIVYDRVQTVYPQTDSVRKSRFLRDHQDEFNIASLMHDSRYRRKLDKPELRIQAPSGRADQMDRRGRYHMAPFTPTARTAYALSMGLSIDNNQPRAYVGNLYAPPIKDFDAIGRDVARGISQASGTSSKYHMSDKKFRTVIRKFGVNQKRRAA